MIARPHTALAGALIALALAASVVLVHASYFGVKTVTAYFTSATAIYPGDGVRVAGIKVGTITAIAPEGGQVRMSLDIDGGVPIPANAKAVIVAANLLAARYVELTPAYRSSDPHANGPTMGDHAVIPIDRTAVPVEWDEVKTQLMRLATELGPNSQVSTPAIARFIDSTANALNGNGDKLRETLNQLAGVGRILADGSGNIADTVKNLQMLVTALRDTNPQIVEFQGRFATLTSILDDNRTDLDAALNNLSSALGEVQRFIAGTRDKTSEQVQRLTNVTSNLVEHRKDLEQLLHVTPTALANGYGDYNPDTGTIMGSISFTNFSNPVQFICAAIGAVKNTTASETAKLCAQYLGPALGQLNFNNLPFPINPALAPSPRNVLYTDPALAPGGTGGTPVPAEQPPSVSAYTGAGDVPPPRGWNQPPAPPGLYAPLPAAPSPALYPGAPPPTVPSVENLLLPAPALQSPPPPEQAAPVPPTEGTPPP
ncbi:MCE family protein [Mycolicibacterium nivoides]|uniref:MCE family protein n=1 Tax=Mycolicibacterium nivoides TaxID=2487344 RepID=UPI0008BB7374|nr:MCE family protein [Mycolicibacterium nivoides]SEQ18954.1 virulence factor Mce family protein [Mycobacterium sp. 88mf]SFF39030.1 virulence factor Mce family protein [Mycobacterium sp. 455mf]